MDNENTKSPDNPAVSSLSSSDWLAPIPGAEYFWKRTKGWYWIDGGRRWWVVSVVFLNGFNGGGGACIEELWRWNSSHEVVRRQPRTLTYAETRNLLRDLSANEENSHAIETE